MDNPAEITYIGKTDFRNAMTRFGIKAVDRTKHMYIIGKTGTGKSTFLENLLVQDIVNGNGFAFIDPHGGSAEKMLEFIPEHRIKDVIYLNPSDTDFPIAFNPLEDTDPTARPLVVDGLMTVFKKIWPDAFSGRMEYILNNTMLALLEYPNPTLLSINRFLTDKDFRKRVVANVSDPTVKNAWDELSRWDDKRWSEATGALINKVGQFTTNPLIRNIVGQVKSTFDFRRAMDDRKILIINLSKGRIGEQNQPLFGAMLITKIYLAAMSRADLDTATQLPKVPPFYFYVDEFQNFANDSFANILSEARKYKLCLTVANQYVNQMAETIRDAVFGNMGTTVAFRVGPLDSPLLEKVFSPIFTANDLENLQFGQFYVTLQIDGMGSRPFSAQSLWPIPAEKQPFKNAVIEASRSTYARPRADVEKEIIEWFGYNNKKVETKELSSEIKAEKKLFDSGASSTSVTPKTLPSDGTVSVIPVPKPVQKSVPDKQLPPQKPSRLPEITKTDTSSKPTTKVIAPKQFPSKTVKQIELLEKIPQESDFSATMASLLDQFEQSVVVEENSTDNTAKISNKLASNVTIPTSDQVPKESVKEKEKPTITESTFAKPVVENRITPKPILPNKDKSAKTETKNALLEALQKAKALKNQEESKKQPSQISSEKLSDVLERARLDSIPSQPEVRSLETQTFPVVSVKTSDDLQTISPMQNIEVESSPHTASVTPDVLHGTYDTFTPPRAVREVPEDILKKILE